MPARGLLSHGKDLEAYICRLPQWPRGKESTCNAGYAGSSIPGSGRSPREGHATHSSILAWKIPWSEEPGVQ